MSIFIVVELAIWFLITQYVFNIIRRKVPQPKTVAYNQQEPSPESKTSSISPEQSTVLTRRHVADNLNETSSFPEDKKSTRSDQLNGNGGRIKTAATLIICIIVGYLSLVVFDTVLVRIIAHSVVYTPQTCTQSDHVLPECIMKLNVSYEHVYFRDNEKDPLLYGLWVPSNSPSPLNVLLNYGSDGNVGFRYYPMFYEWLAKQGVNVFAWDYPGYGHSEGVPSEDGIYRSAESALHWLMNKTKSPSNEIIVQGFSLGGSVAVHLASKHDIKAVILQSPLDKIGYVANTVAPAGGWKLPHILPEQFDSEDKMKNIQVCMFFFCATNDEVFTEERQLLLYDNAINIPDHCKVFFRSVGYGHLDNPLDNPEFGPAFEKFLNLVKG